VESFVGTTAQPLVLSKSMQRKKLARE